MQTNEVLDKLDEMIQGRSILKHPFYRAWLNGELSIEQLATYAEIYYPHVAAFPGYLEVAIQASSDARVSDELERNLADELSHTKAHPERGMGLSGGVGCGAK